jgi:hypothetical protein
MAKNAGRLAGLAALAGAAYMMSRGKGKSDDAGDQKTSSYTGDTKKVGSDGTQLKTPAESIAAADKSDKSTSISTKGAAGTTTPGPDTSVPNLDVKPAPAPKPKPASEPKPVVTDTPSTPPVQVNRTMEDPTKQKVLDTLNQRAGANTPSALRSDQLADVSRAVKREEKTKKAAQADFSDVTRTYKNRDGTPAAQVQKNYDTLNKKSGANTSSAQKTDALMVASRAAKAADAKRH